MALIPHISVFSYETTPAWGIRRIDVRADVPAIRSGSLVRTVVDEPVVSAGEVDESHIRHGGRKEVVGRIVLCAAADQYILDERCARKVSGESQHGIAKRVASADS